VHDPAVLDRAAALGHAMQLTNILRDVGEDLEAGRVYLPAETLRAAGLDLSDLIRMRTKGMAHSGYPAMIEALMAEADSAYAFAFAAIPALPRFFQRPVAVAADVYRGIHDVIRRNGYDNMTRRARTTRAAKVRLAAGALWRLRRIGRASNVRPSRSARGELAGNDAG
jgi:phytoene synthase